MELKRILARDSRSANEKAIQLYGPDVLIISSQRMDNQTELIVAVDLDTTKPAPAQASGTTELHTETTAEEGFVPFSKLFQSASAFAPLPSDELPVEAAKPVESQKPAVPVVLRPAQTAVEIDPVATLVSEASVQQMRHENQRNREIVELMRQEMAALRKEFSLSRQMMPWQDGLRLSPAVQQLSLTMSEAGVPAGLRALLTDSIQGLSSVQEALPVMQSLLCNALRREAVTIPDSGVHALCGPSGAGKTSMVGRLALAAAQAHGAENQVMISFADQRPGAWAQMQLLAAQSGVACYRATNSDMLRTLLEDLEGKTVWIDTCGTDFAAQAELLSKQHPLVLRHAVLPVDATVTSVQKILQNSTSTWTSLMLSKVDEAAYPWALIKGLSEHSLPVSCVSSDSRIGQVAESFDVVNLVKLALSHLETDSAKTPGAEASTALLVKAPVRRTRTKKPALKGVNPSTPEDDILIPTLLGAVSLSPARRKIVNTSSVLKVAHG